MIRRGFTLLEVVLTLAMAAMLMALIGSTLQFYAVTMNLRNLEVRRIHLAASILQMISDDLRAGLHAEPFDDSTLESFLAGAVGGAVEGAIDPAIAETLGIGGSDLMPSDLSLEPDLSLDLISSTMTLQQPGLIGGQDQLQIDISRLPRLEQWQMGQGSDPDASGKLADIPSDIKTVTYYVQPPGSIDGVPDPLQSILPAGLSQSGVGAPVPGGLVRRELDRAANKWAIESGGIARLLSTGDLIATEILAIEFSYFDGMIWQPFWNSDQMQALPLAVQVTLTLGERPRDDADASLADAGATAQTFVQIIQLPAGRMVPMNDLMMETMP
ncbi:MAG: prepilin-type N-terminal cleavage/methylation domain-containing protein [Planctomycetaceae bacterium]|nr:MAG: prepilin-type N-terminal cleavage/methylation domain-containing protein [Planctomycetaceae bacterium]